MYIYIYFFFFLYVYIYIEYKKVRVTKITMNDFIKQTISFSIKDIKIINLEKQKTEPTLCGLLISDIEADEFKKHSVPLNIIDSYKITLKSLQKSLPDRYICTRFRQVPTEK